jgi:hypothetical protein
MPATRSRDQGLPVGETVDLISVWIDGERRAKGFRAVEYETRLVRGGLSPAGIPNSVQAKMTSLPNSEIQGGHSMPDH